MINAQMMPSMLPMGGSKVPFSFSGSWETGNEGWTLTSSTLLREEYLPRTGTMSLYTNGGGSGGTYQVGYYIPADIAGKMNISVSVYSRAEGNVSNLYRSIGYQIGLGSIVILDSVTNTSTTYALLDGSFSNPDEEFVVIWVQGQRTDFPGNVSLFDDWAISGVPL